jgi:demethylmenaquinone methyltransferase/2-methoxy-6-polyprenyl-1,4-benzoquinol methylase
MEKQLRKSDRVKRTKAEAKASYDRLSRWYDLLAGRSERKFKREGLRRLAVVDGERVLEIGCGTGECALALAASVGRAGIVHGIDISQGMLDRSRSRIDRAGMSDRVELRCGDAAKLPYDAAVFDAVFTSFTLELFDTPEIPAVLSECSRVLKGHGRICAVAMSREGKQGFMVKLYQWTHGRFPRFADCRPIYVARAMRAAGFQVRSATIMTLWRMPVEIVLAVKPSAGRDVPPEPGMNDCAIISS